MVFKVKFIEYCLVKIWGDARKEFNLVDDVKDVLRGVKVREEEVGEFVCILFRILKYTDIFVLLKFCLEFTIESGSRVWMGCGVSVGLIRGNI